MMSILSIVWSFFSGSNTGRTIGLGVLGIFGALMLLGLYYVHINSVESAARAEAAATWQRQQLEQVVADQQRTLVQLDQLRVTQERLADAVRIQREALIRSVSEINNYLSSSEAQSANRPSSAPLREVVRRLSALSQTNTPQITLPPSQQPVSRRRISLSP